MKEVLGLIGRYNIEILLGLLIALLLLLVLNIISRMKISKITEKYNELVRGSDSENIEALLLELGSQVDSLTNQMNMAKRDIESLENKLSFAVQKVDVIRYDAFDEMGSEQSFSLAFLDEHNTGMIMTSIFGRDYSSNFIKPIEKGKSEYKLSVEEMQVLDRAIKQ